MRFSSHHFFKDSREAQAWQNKFAYQSYDYNIVMTILDEYLLESELWKHTERHESSQIKLNELK